MIAREYQEVEGSLLTRVDEQSMRRVAKAGGRWPGAEFTPRITELVSERFITRQVAIYRVAENASEPFSGTNGSDAVTAFFPKLSHYHALDRGGSLGFSLLEPQASTGIAHFCQGEGDLGLKKRRCIAAVRALLPTETEDTPIMASLAEGRLFEVEAEAAVGDTGRRIDWIVRWKHDLKGKFCVVIEMKYGHVVTSGQLQAYCQHGIRHATTPEEHLRLILLTRDGTVSHNNPHWRPVSWMNFLRRWEKELQRLDDTALLFGVFRYQLWARI